MPAFANLVRIVELDHDGKIIRALGQPGHESGRITWPHFVVIAGKGGFDYLVRGPVQARSRVSTR